MKLESEKQVVEAPMSFMGSSKRIWNTTFNKGIGYKLLAILAISVVWSIIICWYLFFGLLLVPYRLLRRSQRGKKVTALQHREMLNQIQGKEL